MIEFTAHIANLGKYNAGVLADTALSFPATTEQVQAALRRIGVDGLRCQEIIILEYTIGVKGVARALGEFAHLDELNYLASRLDSLDPEELMKFTAAVEHGEYASSAEDMINLTYNLDRYELYPVQNAEEYGHWLIDELEAIKLPESVPGHHPFYSRGDHRRHPATPAETGAGIVPGPTEGPPAQIQKSKTKVRLSLWKIPAAPRSA